MSLSRGHWYSPLLSPWVIFAALLSGVLFGVFAPNLAVKFSFIGNIYLALLQMCIIPLVIAAITTSFAKLMHSKVESQLIRRMIVLFLSSLVAAAFLGLIVAWIGNIGGGLDQGSQNHLGSLLLTADSVAHAYGNTSHFLDYFITNNIFKALSEGKNIPILIFAILLGIALGFITDKTGKQTLVFFDGLFKTLLTLVNGIMHLLPIGIFTLIADEVASSGFQIFAVAGKLIVCTYIIGFFLIILFIFILAKKTKTNVFKTFYYLRETIIVAFVSGSSFAALPFGIASLHNNFKLSNTKVNLFFPLSVCLNPVGTAYFLALVAVFVSQLYGHPIGLHEAVLIGLMSVITAVAIGAVPAVAGFALLGMLFEPLGLPSSVAIVLLLSISNVLDPIITVVDVVADAMATVLLSKPEEGIREEIEELLS